MRLGKRDDVLFREEIRGRRGRLGWGRDGVKRKKVGD